MGGIDYNFIEGREQMERHRLLANNLKRINSLYCILKHSKECGWNNCRIPVKAIELLLDSIKTLYTILDGLLDLAIDIDEYNRYVEEAIRVEGDYFYKVDETYYISIKEKLYRIIQELSSLGLTYEDMPHTYNTYIILDNYIWDNNCSNEFILKFSYDAILNEDILLIKSMFEDIFRFILQNSKIINRIYCDEYIQQLLVKSKSEKVTEKQLKSIFIRADRISYRRQNSSIIDTILIVCVEIMNLIY